MACAVQVPLVPHVTTPTPVDEVVNLSSHVGAAWVPILAAIQVSNEAALGQLAPSAGTQLGRLDVLACTLRMVDMAWRRTGVRPTTGRGRSALGGGAVSNGEGSRNLALMCSPTGRVRKVLSLV